MDSPIEFGGATRRDHYSFDVNVAYLNQGSYGPCPRFVQDDFLTIRKIQEGNPDLWFRKTKADLYLKALHMVADRFDCQFEQIALVENVTCGINAVLKTSLPSFQKPGGTILYTNQGYGSVIYTIKEAAKQHQMKTHELDIKLPIQSKDSLIKLFEEEIEKIDDLRLAVIDHISSTTAIMFPIEELTELFHRRGIPVLIDGAHAPNQVLDLSLSKLKCEFYVGSLHKWMFTARGTAFIFVRDPNVANQIQPSITSWGYQPSLAEPQYIPFHLQFFYQGTRDETAMFTIPKSIEFIDSICGGFERIYEYNTKLAQKTKKTLDERWQNDGKNLMPLELESPFLKMVKLPDLIAYEKSDADALRLLEDLLLKHQIVTVIVHVNGELYLRLSTQIYNEFDDYTRLADLIDTFR
ncbi:unnamed protein product, partial [Mesorhabditis belari]|uniref:Aminotransferase class V domain-containing protein n=1 Tax=Mesorhabditis belari TaxID=2138241 RepID=A0AAF3J4H1_9BILA